jgi:MFS transporter, AAHS family, vanillate permease
MASAAAAFDGDIREQIETGPMTTFQLVALGICWTINMLDGFDVLAIAFTAPEVSREWGLEPTALGIVFSAGLFGMMAGALLLAPLGDYFGRRLTILGGLATITGGMIATAYVDNVYAMVLMRVITGLGIGAILASLTTMTAEYSSNRRRNLSISFMHAGYPIGAIIGGLISVYLIHAFGWRSVFVFGGAASAIMMPLVYFLLPESVNYLLDKQPRHALRDVNAIAARCKLPPLDRLPDRPSSDKAPRISVAALFSRDYLAATLALWLAFFLSMVALYFLLNWTPKVIVNSGLSADQGRFAGVLMNAGGALAMTLLGWLSAKFGLIRLIQIYFLISAVMIMVFATAPLPTGLLMVFAFLMGSVMAGLVGLYSVAARLYPTQIRNTGVGWAIGVGRWGAVFGPAAAGWMIAAELDRWTYFLVLGAAPAVLAAMAVGFIKLRTE